MNDDVGRVEANNFLERLQQATYARLELKPTIYDSQWLSRFVRNAPSKTLFNTVFGSEPRQSKVRILAGWRRTVDQIKGARLDDIEKAFREIPTRYENPFNYRILRGLQTEIENTLAAMHAGGMLKSVLPKVVVGTLPTGEVNARAILVPSSEYFLVVFDSQMFNFVNLLSKALSLAIPPREVDGKIIRSMRPEDILQAIGENPDAAERLKEVMSMYLTIGTPEGAAPYTLEERYQEMAGLLRDGMELFAVGHEYGHIASGHFTPQSPIHDTEISGTPVSEYLGDWDQEFQADRFAAQVSSLALQTRGVHRFQSFIGSDFFFASTMLVERGLNVLNNGCDEPFRLSDTEQRTSHPPAGLRMAMIEQAMKGGLPEQDFEILMGLRGLLLGALDVLWRATVLPLLLRMHHQNVRPSKVWLDILRQHQTAAPAATTRG
jgi:hypothetical protein